MKYSAGAPTGKATFFAFCASAASCPLTIDAVVREIPRQRDTSMLCTVSCFWRHCATACNACERPVCFLFRAASTIVASASNVFLSDLLTLTLPYADAGPTVFNLRCSVFVSALILSLRVRQRFLKKKSMGHKPVMFQDFLTSSDVISSIATTASISLIFMLPISTALLLAAHNASRTHRTVV